MTELDEKMQPIKDTFMLIFKLSQVESILSPVPKALSSNFETQVKEIAHNIRNTNGNRKIKERRIYKHGQITLLDQFSM